MTPTEIVILGFAVAAFLLVGVPVAVFVWVIWREKRAERSRIEEWEDRFWRQVG